MLLILPYQAQSRYKPTDDNGVLNSIFCRLQGTRTRSPPGQLTLSREAEPVTASDVFYEASIKGVTQRHLNSTALAGTVELK
jgi:hypothetical protein